MRCEPSERLASLSPWSLKRSQFIGLTSWIRKAACCKSTDFRRFDRKYGHLSMAVLHRGDLHQALFSELTGLAIRTGMECVDARQARDRVHLTFAGGEVIEAELVLACDGIHSAVRKAIFPDSRERFARYTWWRAIAPGIPVGMDRACLTESWGGAKRFGLAAVRGNEVYWFACCPADRMDDPLMAKVDLRSLQAMFAEFHEPIPEILSRTSPEALIWTDILDLAPMSSFTRGSVVLLGDAAHAVTPDLGQGAGLAIEDAAVLTSLLGCYPIERALREFNARRVRRAHKIAAGSRFYAAIARWQNPIMVRVRDVMIRNIPERLVERQLGSILDNEIEPLAPNASLLRI
jgi:2-polyprenyl-6-methoxyphenol hydroxylase-like FAD-dependent oxidoreductase